MLHTCSSFHVFWFLYMFCVKINFVFLSKKKTDCFVDEEEEEEDDQILSWHNCPLVKKVNLNEHGHTI